ncbi:MAG: fimbrillin family protein [Prevotella sp.]|nr:fimbrillin family protein [Prevotella sp.]
MKVTFNSIKNGLLMSVVAMGAAALTGCSSELAEQQSGGAADGPAAARTAVEIVPSFVEQTPGLTRAADGLNTSTSGFSNNALSARIFVDQGSLSSAFTEFDYTCSGTTMTPPTTAPTFPAASSVRSVNVYGWYPAQDASKSFTILTDQSTDLNYAKSDLMLANQAECSREPSTSDATQWTVTQAALSFRHVMSKAKITFKSVDGTSITAVKLKNIKPTVTINDDTKTSLAIGDAGGTAVDVTLWTGTMTDITDVVACGVFPPQTIAANGNFIEVVTSTGSVLYTVGTTAKVFEGGKEYAVTIEVGTSDVGHIVSLGDWTQNSQNAIFYNVDYRVAQSTSKMSNNLLYYVAQYNNSSKTAFATEHVIYDAPVFNHTDAKACAIANYHLPSINEQVGIIPSNSITANGPNLFSVVTSINAESPYTLNETGVARGKNSTTDISGSLNSLFIRGNAANELYAVRFINTDYASAWHYKWAGNGLIIESYVLNVKPTTEAEGKIVLGALPSSPVWATAANVAPATDNSGKSFCSRYLPACGNFSGSSGTATTNVGKACNYWSSSTGGSGAFHWRVLSGYLDESSAATTYGFSVRMFHD